MAADPLHRPIASGRRVGNDRRTARAVLGSVRVRTTLAALAVVFVTLALAGTGLVWLLHLSLENGLVNTATTEAIDVGGVVAQGTIPTDLRVRPGYAVQVVNDRGTVLASSADLAGRHAVSALRPPTGTRARVTVGPDLAGDDNPDLAVAYTVMTRHGPTTIYALASVEQAEDSVHDLAIVLLLSMPVLLVLSGVLAWLLAGRALRPVEAIRAEVAGVSAGDLDRRVPEPPFDDEIGRLARTMNEMLARLQSAQHRQRQFVSDASHELRSPIAALLAQVEVAGAHPELADWSAVSSAVAEEGSRLWRIVDDLLLLARSDEGHLAPGTDDIDLDDLVLAEAARLRTAGKVAVDLGHVGAGRVVGDREQLRRVVRNLADNAERHARSLVTFELGTQDSWVCLVVADDGPGIPEDQRERVFERFARVDESRHRPAGGTGLGLAIVREIIAVHGGTVAVADRAIGARIEIHLPAAPT